VNDVVQQLVSGLTLGCIYGLIALGYTLIFGVVRVIFFAQGELSMIGAFAALALFRAIGLEGPPILRAAAAIAAAAAGATIVGMLAERLTVRPILRAPRTNQLVASLGVSLILQNAIMLAVSPENLAFPSLVGTGSFNLLGARITVVQVFILATACVAVAAVQFVLHGSRLGLRIRAVAANRETAELDGISVRRVMRSVFIIGSIAAAVAGVMTASYDGIVKYNMGFLPGIKGFTAAILGGFGRPIGAIAGGLVLGLSESLTAGYLSSTYKDVVAFAILVVILIVRPKGLVEAA
jgi:branched-chain amino acid transport system permease protein